MKQRNYMSITQLAKHLGISTTSARYLAKSERLRGINGAVMNVNRTKGGGKYEVLKVCADAAVRVFGVGVSNIKKGGDSLKKEIIVINFKVKEGGGLVSVVVNDSVPINKSFAAVSNNTSSDTENPNGAAIIVNYTTNNTENIRFSGGQDIEVSSDSSINIADTIFVNMHISNNRPVNS